MDVVCAEFTLQACFRPRCVTASVTSSASMTRQLLAGQTPRLRPFRVTDAERGVRKGIVADGLRDLTDKVGAVPRSAPVQNANQK